MSTPVLKPLLKPLLILLGTASMIFFGGIIALSLPESGLNAKDTAENLINRVNGLDGVNSSDSSNSPGNTDQPANLATSQTNIVPASTATTITAQQAMAVASQYLPNDNLQAPIELVNYNGSAAYEVPLSSGPVYVDAWSAQLLNPPATTVVNGKQYEREDDESEHHEDKDHHERKHKDKHKEDRRKTHRDEHDEERALLMVADNRHHEKSEYANRDHDEESYDD